jgi:hypothetical protein
MVLVMGPFLSRLGFAIWPDGIYETHPAERFRYELYPSDLALLVEYVTKNRHRLTSSRLHELWSELCSSAGLVESCLPIAAELSEEHLRLWVQIITSVRQVASMELYIASGANESFPSVSPIVERHREREVNVTIDLIADVGRAGAELVVKVVIDWQ